jgi:hypothetical protein
MRPAITTLALALWLLGCGLAAPRGEPVDLLTGVDSCYAGGQQGVEGPLVADPEYGTRLNGKPVMWPVGFTGVRLVGGEVAVLDTGGKVVVTTGRRYYLSYGPEPHIAANHQLMERVGAFPAGANCYSWDVREVTPSPESAPGGTLGVIHEIAPGGYPTLLGAARFESGLRAPRPACSSA